jgi:hypothetical protein
MGADDASSADMPRPPADPDTDPLALDEETLERLLAGGLPPDQAPPGYAQVAELLAAAAAAPNAEELVGQAAAVAELRAVTRARPARASTLRARRPGTRRRMGLAVVVAVGVLVTGGAAAAATGHLPGPVRDAARSIVDTVGGGQPAAPTQPGRQPAPVTQTPAPGGAANGTQGPRPADATDPGPGPGASGPTPGPDKEGLCQAYLAGKGAERGKQLEAAAFEALAEAAGGAEKIPAYCRGTLPGEAKAKKPKQQAPPDSQGQGQGESPSTGDGNQGQGGPPESRSPTR